MITPPKQSRDRLRVVLSFTIAGLLGGLPAGLRAEPPAAPAILRDLRSFREMGSVLYVAAHPDDENTQLITYLARGRNYRTAYLSLTRGDGGQNVLGPEFFEKLGVARTQELLAARRLDGGRQYFTRAIDFGFSKDANETLNLWDRDQVVSDIVRVIRTFRPDVMINRFSTQPGGTHGHHTSSAILALEAFKLAGDSRAFPDQLNELTPWQPKRILANGRGGSTNEGLRMEINGNDPVLGVPFGEVAGRSRAMHKTQGFGNFSGGGGGRTESFQVLAGEPATDTIMDGIDTTWARVPGGAEIGKLTDEIIAAFKTEDPSASVPALLKLRGRLAALPAKDPVVTEKRTQLDRILQACLGLEVATTIPQAEVVPGEQLKLHHTATLHSREPVRWINSRYPGIPPENKKAVLAKALELRPGEAASREATQTLPASTPLTQPYWLLEESTPGMFRVMNPSLIGTPENAPVFPIEHLFEVGGQTLVVPDEPLAHSAKGEVRRLDVIPPVSLNFVSDVALFPPGTAQPVEVEVVAARRDLAGSLQLETPAGWKAEPAKQSFRLAAIGDRARLKFTVTAPAQATTAKIIANAEIGGAHYRNQRQEVFYPHIPRQLLQPLASLKAVSLDLKIRGQKVGYLPGAGDSVADHLQQMGYAITLLEDADLTPDRLREFDAVVIGVRAYNVRPNLPAQLPALFAYVEGGGTVIAQYNRPDNKVTKLAPFDLKLSSERVTDENAAVTFLAPEHPVLNTPNKITSDDFSGWVQERGIYFPNQWDERFTPILACADAGEPPRKGALLVAQHGKGHFVYTGLVFFRELPAGVPGAYRLFANLVSLGK